MIDSKQIESLGDRMTTAQAMSKIAMHAGRTEDFSNGYRYALKYGFCNWEEIQRRFDEIFACLKVLEEGCCLFPMDQDLLADLNEILLGSIVYVNRQEPDYRIVGAFAEVLSETLLSLLTNEKEPFTAFDNYKENYDDIFCAMQ